MHVDCYHETVMHLILEITLLQFLHMCLSSDEKLCFYGQ